MIGFVSKLDLERKRQEREETFIRLSPNLASRKRNEALIGFGSKLDLHEKQKEMRRWSDSTLSLTLIENRKRCNVALTQLRP